jgi:hypothetical protein
MGFDGTHARFLTGPASVPLKPRGACPLAAHAARWDYPADCRQVATRANPECPTSRVRTTSFSALAAEQRSVLSGAFTVLCRLQLCWADSFVCRHRIAWHLAIRRLEGPTTNGPRPAAQVASYALRRVTMSKGVRRTSGVCRRAKHQRPKHNTRAASQCTTRFAAERRFRMCHHSNLRRHPGQASSNGAKRGLQVQV